MAILHILRKTEILKYKNRVKEHHHVPNAPTCFLAATSRISTLLPCPPRPIAVTQTDTWRIWILSFLGRLWLTMPTVHVSQEDRETWKDKAGCQHLMVPRDKQDWLRTEAMLS